MTGGGCRLCSPCPSAGRRGPETGRRGKKLLLHGFGRPATRLASWFPWRRCHSPGLMLSVHARPLHVPPADHEGARPRSPCRPACLHNLSLHDQQTRDLPCRWFRLCLRRSRAADVHSSHPTPRRLPCPPATPRLQAEVTVPQLQTVPQKLPLRGDLSPSSSRASGLLPFLADLGTARPDSHVLREAFPDLSRLDSAHHVTHPQSRHPGVCTLGLLIRSLLAKAGSPVEQGSNSSCVSVSLWRCSQFE